MQKVTLKNKVTGNTFPMDAEAWQKAKPEWGHVFKEVPPLEVPEEVQALRDRMDGPYKNGKLQYN